MLIDSTGDDTSPMITGDGANIYFASNRDDGAHFRIYLSGRSRTFDPFGASAVGNGFPGAASLSGPAPFNERPLFETPDRCILYLTSDGMPTVVNGPADDGRPADAGTGSSMTGYDLYSGNRL